MKARKPRQAAGFCISDQPDDTFCQRMGCTIRNLIALVVQITSSSSGVRRCFRAAECLFIDARFAARWIIAVARDKAAQ
jgi:hypothetical protein